MTHSQMTPGDRPRALITGASVGIGRCFARQLAADGYDLCLVARTRTTLEALAQELEAEHAISVHVIPADLSTLDGVSAVTDYVDAQRVDVLINNAGYGLGQRFLDAPISETVAMERVLIEAVAVVTWHAARKMRERGRGGIITVSSMTAVTSMGMYAASKSAALIMMESLAGELADTPITVTAVLPGFVSTEFHERMGVVHGSTDSLLWLKPEDVVTQALKDARAGRVVSVASPQYRFLYGLSQIIPRFITRSLSVAYERDRWLAN